jgi:hypothetical protein
MIFWHTLRSTLKGFFECTLSTLLHLPPLSSTVPEDAGIDAAKYIHTLYAHGRSAAGEGSCYALLVAVL